MTYRAREEDKGLRLDQLLARETPGVSRARIQQWIAGERVRVDGAVAKASLRLRGTETIEWEPGEPAVLTRAFPEDLPLEVLYEDDYIVAVNKPAGMAVHVGAGVSRGTLVNALLHRFGRLSTVGGPFRPGIVHRLDRLTSGVLLIAKNDTAHIALTRQFARRQVRKIYVALVHGAPPDRGRPVVLDGVLWMRLEMPIRRDLRAPRRMTARARSGRDAVTDYRVLEALPGYSLLEIRPGTGRTHQIRVHLSTIGHPVVGDTLYGAPAQPALGRFFLHAKEIEFAHPATGRMMVVRAPLPAELQSFLDGIMRLKHQS